MRAKLLALSFFLLITVNAFSQTATAPSVGDGTSGNPWQIATLDNLYWLSQTSAQWVAGKYFIQTANIDASSTSTWFSDGSGGYYGFPCIGGAQTTGGQQNAIFYGNYNGQGYKILNLYIRRPGDRIGLFGRIQTPATIKNLVLETPTVIISSTSGVYGAGILIGYANQGTVDNIYIKGGSITSNNVSAIFASVGTIVGWEDGLTASNISTSASVTTNLGYVGAVVGVKGSYTSSYTNCKATGNVTSTSGYRVGGFIGINDNGGPVTFSKCSASGNVSASGLAGGFVGYPASTGQSNFTNCYAFGNVAVSSSSGGGFFGYSGTSNTSVFTNCYSKGAVTGSSTGGFGYYTGGTYTYNNCFWDSQTSGKSNALQSSTPAGITGKTTVQMTDATTFTNATWDFSTIWIVTSGINSGYPYLISNGSTLPVSWLSFTGRAIHGDVELNWSTASELNNSHFEIQRSANAIDFSTIGSVAAGANPSVVNNYQYLDLNPFSGTSYYRLKQVDIDGKFSFSSIIQINGTPLSEIKIYSDAEALHVLVPASVSGTSVAFIYDAAGRLMQKQQVLPGRNVISTVGLSGGNYFVQLVNGGKNIYSNQFVK